MFYKSFKESYVRITINKAINFLARIIGVTSKGKVIHLCPHPAIIPFFGMLLLLFYSEMSPIGLACYIIGYVSLAFGIFAGVCVGGKIKRKRRIPKDQQIGLALFFVLVSIIAISLNLLKSGFLPMLNRSLRFLLDVKLTYLSFLLIPGICLIAVHEKVRERFLAFFVIASAIISLLGFRTEIFVAIISGSVIGLRKKFITIFDIFAIILIVIALILFLKVRISSTLSVYDVVAIESFPEGLYRGSVLISSFSSVLPIPGPKLGPRTLIGNIVEFRKGVTATSTLLGPWVADFGVYSLVIFALLLGLMLGVSYSYQKKYGECHLAFYAILFSFTLTGIETGIVDIVVFFYFFLAMLSILYETVPSIRK